MKASCLLLFAFVHICILIIFPILPKLRRNTVNSSPKASCSVRISSLDLDSPRRRGINTGNACTFNHFVYRFLSSHYTVNNTRAGSDRLLSVKAEVRLIFLIVAPSIHSFISRTTSVILCVNIVFNYPAAAVSKLQSSPSVALYVVCVA